MEAYFRDHRTISSEDVQLDVAESVGIDRDEFARRLDDGFDGFRAAVVDEWEQAQELGITGIPSVVADGRYLVSGAVDVEQYVRVVEHVEAERTGG